MPSSLTSPPPSLLFFALLFTSHRSPLSERLEQATFPPKLPLCLKAVQLNTVKFVFFIKAVYCTLIDGKFRAIFEQVKVHLNSV